MADATSNDSWRRPGDAAPRVRIFINYRREDTQFMALLLYDRLMSKFGAENIFLDEKTLQPGMEWLKEIKSHGDSCHVFLALIGPHWMSIMTERGQEAIVRPAEDYCRLEIERALKLNSGIQVIPVLVGNDVPFEAEKLRGSIRALAKCQVAYVRPVHSERDIELLINRIEEIAREQLAISPKSAAVHGEEWRLALITTGAKGVAQPPDAAHCEYVLKQMIDEGNVVPFLGARLTTGRDGTAEEMSSLPDDEALAAALAEQFGIVKTRLPEIAQYVYVTKGRPDLYRVLKRRLTIDYEPGPVHRFLARFPARLEKLGLEKRYQLIVSTSFDRTLERAFDDENEPYDLAVYMASGPDKGKFIHFSSEGYSTRIDHPNSYTKFPIGEDYELERTVIVKIHGVVDGSVGDYRWRENYVITEDHYIDYLSKGPIEGLVPVQILDKIKESHGLFLGYAIRDWNLRVFLKRIWEGSIGAKSWAVEPDPDLLEKDIWAQSNVDLYAAHPGDYVELLEGLLSARIGNR